jgi:hypothetical protein
VADHVVDEAVDLTETGRTNRLGRLLAPAGVRYVAMPSTQGLGGGTVAPPAARLRAGLADQLDLARLATEDGLVLYENLAWIPLEAVVGEPAAADVPTGAVGPARSALGTDVAGAAEPVSGSRAVGPGVLLWGEAYDDAWSATADGADVAHLRTFGWANGYALEARRAVSIRFDDQWVRWALLGASLLIWLGAARRWWTTRTRRDRSATPAGAVRRERRERREREPRADPLAEVLEEDAYWWERV